MTPPLAERNASRRARDGGAVRTRCSPVLRGVTIGGDLHGRAAIAVHAPDVAHARDIAAGGRQVDPLAIARPVVEGVVDVVEGDALQLTGGERQYIDVAVAGAGRHEGESGPIRRPEGTALGGRV